MSFHARRIASIAVCGIVVFAAHPGMANAVATTKLLGVKIPASELLGREDKTTSTPAGGATTRAHTGTTPATPTHTTGAGTGTTIAVGGGAQPGTVAPGATTTPTATTTTPASAASGTTTTSGSVTVIRAPSARARARHTRLSALAIALLALGALLLAAGGGWALARWLGLEPRWAQSLTYSLREANYRASATWAEFADWARLGR